MKSLGWTTPVVNYSHLDVDKLSKEQQRLHKMLVYPSQSGTPNYKNINKDFLKELKNQQDPAHVQIVLSWLDHGIFSDGWGLLSGGKFHGKDFYELAGADKKQIISLLKTMKAAFYENKFQPMYVHMKDKNQSIETYLNALEFGNAMGIGKVVLDKSSNFKIAKEKLSSGEKLPRKLKKEVIKTTGIKPINMVKKLKELQK